MSAVEEVVKPIRHELLEEHVYHLLLAETPQLQLIQLIELYPHLAHHAREVILLSLGLEKVQLALNVLDLLFKVTTFHGLLYIYVEARQIVFKQELLI